MVFTVHLMASIWIWVGGGEQGWIKGLLVEPDNPFHVYVASVYYVMTTFTTVGYGDIKGRKNEEYFVEMIIEVSLCLRVIT